MTELKFSLKKDLQSGEIDLKEMDEDSLAEYIKTLCVNLEKYVYTKNRIDLYNKEGIGLAIAIDQRDLEQEEYTSIYYPVHNSEGVSKSSRTQSAEEYMRL